MPTQNIKTLRQEGKLDEALALALAENEAHPDDPRTWNDIVWCYDAFCKRAAIDADLDQFQKAFDELVSMHEFETNRTLSDTMCWRLRALLANMTNGKPAEEIPTLADKVFPMLKEIHPAIPSEPYSVLCKAFYKCREQWDNFPAFMEQWGWDSFRPEDYQCEELPNGKKMPISLVEGCHIGTAKILIKQQDKEAIEAFLPRMEQLSQAHPEMIYVNYYIGKLMLANGQVGEDAVKAVCPFVRKKKSEFWAWQMLSEAYADNQEKRLACLLRAADCKTQEGFLVKVRLELTHEFLLRHDYANAGYQLHKYVAEKERQQSGLPRDIWHQTQESWYKENNPEQRPDVHLDYLSITNEILCGDYPVHLGVVSFVNHDKKMATVVYGKEKSGFFKYDRLLKQVRVGDLLVLKWDEISGDGFIKPLVCTPISEDEAKNLQPADGPLDTYYRIVSGKTRSNYAGNAWFLRFDGESAFIPGEYWRKHPLDAGQQLTAHILWDCNKTRGDWGWRCLNIL